MTTTLYNEAVEVCSEDALKDLGIFTTVCQDIRNVMEKISHLKMKKPDKWKDNVQELQLEGSFHFLTLKKLNRLAQIRCKNLKESTLDSKQKLDGNNLRLQNLQYEISHLDREVNNCLQFKSKHDDIDLIPVKEFYESAPEAIAKRNETEGNEHVLTLARLDWELENRKSLKRELNETHKVKEEVMEGIKKKKEDLQSLRPCLENVLQSTLQLQEAFGDHITAMRELHENARLLPRPLYVLFFQAKAYSEACCNDMEVHIEGDKTAAGKLKNLQQRKFVDATSKYTEQANDESDSDEEREEQESKRGRRKSTTKAVPPTNPELIESVMSQHPFRISLKIPLESRSNLLLRFRYYTDLEIVTVESELDIKTSAISTEDNPFLETQTLLHNLQETDEGMDVLQKVRSNFPNIKHDISLRSKECAYLWVQRLAGIDLLDEATNDMQRSFVTMQKVIELLKSRVTSRLSLSSQLEKFSNHVIICDTSITEKFAPSVQFELKQWKKTDFETYSKMDYTRTAVELGLATRRDHFFTAVLQRGTSANVDVMIVITDKYPEQWPLFCLQLCWRGNHTAENDLNIREIEIEANCRLPELGVSRRLRNELLTAQMYRLLTLFDVYVETDCANSGSDLPSEFAMNKLCPRVAKGPARLKPFKYNPKHRYQSY